MRPFEAEADRFGPEIIDCFLGYMDPEPGD